MSGGVDSAVAAYLLRREGFDVLGVFMKNWDEKDGEGRCTSDGDWDDVRAVCDNIGIPYYAVNFAREYWDDVFALCLDEYSKGRTPNPDVLCNREIKFKAFLNFAIKLGAEGIATGHFCRTNGEGDLLKGIDLSKDQSYFLYMLKQAQLRRTRFPVGDMTKSQVREIAKDAGLPVFDKKDSTGVCFIGERRFKPFLQQYIPAQPGDIRARSGEIVGRHDGLMFYTLGQRRGLGIGGRGTGERWFVVSKDLQTNTLWVDQGADSPELYASKALCEDASWIAGEPPVEAGESFECTARFRHRQADQYVNITIYENELLVQSREAQRALTPGQAVVFYQGDKCLGGATLRDIVK
jgi:tRNA-specific 2-thiouridylase